MSLNFPYIGDKWLLQSSLGNNTTKLRLFTNNITPAKTDVASTYTECTASGYAAISLSGGTWTYTTQGNEADYATQTFTLTSSATVYGYYVTDSAGTTLLFSELFSNGPYNIPANGSIAITLHVTDN